jgi:hypothetical protein
MLFDRKKEKIDRPGDLAPQGVKSTYGVSNPQAAALAVFLHKNAAESIEDVIVNLYKLQVSTRL